MSDRFAQELSSLCEWDAFPQRQPALDGERRHRSVNINLLSPPNIEGVEIASKSCECISLTHRATASYDIHKAD